MTVPRTMDLPPSSGLERLLILDAIEGSEQRKARVRAIERKIEEASQMWWREVLGLHMTKSIVSL